MNTKSELKAISIGIAAIMMVSLFAVMTVSASVVTDCWIGTSDNKVYFTISSDAKAEGYARLDVNGAYKERKKFSLNAGETATLSFRTYRWNGVDDVEVRNDVDDGCCNPIEPTPTPTPTPSPSPTPTPIPTPTPTPSPTPSPTPTPTPTSKPPVSLGEAVDNPGLSWSTGGDADCFSQRETYYYDGDAAESGDISDNQDTWMETTVSGPGPLSFYWKVSSEAHYDYLRFYIDGVQQDSIAGSTSWTQKTYSNIGSGSHTLTWRYTKDGSVSNGEDCGWVDKVEFINDGPPPPPPPPQVSLGEAVDNTDLSWSTGGDADCFGQRETYYYDGDAAESGDISNNQDTWMETTVSGPGPLSFYWKVSSESRYDYLRFYIDGVQQDSIAGSTSWTQKTYSNIGSGSHTLTWKYTKDGSVTHGEDCGWVDKVEFINDGPPPPPPPPQVSLGEAVDNTDLSWSTGGDADCFGQRETYYYDGDAAESGDISNNQDTWMETTVSGPGPLSFYWKVSSESHYDYLRFYIDGVQQDSIAGSTSWTQKTYSNIGSGSHTLTWKYTKDGSVTHGEDCGWVDKVECNGGDPPEYWAVIVGVNDYADINDLSYCVNDANDIYNVLRSYDNWEESNMEKLIDSAATKANIHNAIDRMETNADDNDVCLFYFSGHGGWTWDVYPFDEPDETDEYICPHDATLTVEGTLTVEDSIRDDELDEWMTPITAKKIVILDTCFAGGAFRGTDTSTKTKPNVPYPKLAKDFAKDLTRDINKPGYVVLAAVDNHEEGNECGDLENGVFTYYVVEGLAGPANADADNDISAEEIFTFAEPRTIDYAAEQPPDPDQILMSQHPQMYDGVPGELPVVYPVVQW